MGPQFHETGYGRRFFDQQLPSLTKAIEKLTEATEKLTKTNEEKTSSKDESSTTILSTSTFPPISEETSIRLQNVMKDKEKSETFASVLFEEIFTDEEAINKVGYYAAKAILNNSVEELLVAISGWTTKSLLDKMDEFEKGEK